MLQNLPEVLVKKVQMPRWKPGTQDPGLSTSAQGCTWEHTAGGTKGPAP